jgi:hypothetical protein
LPWIALLIKIVYVNIGEKNNYEWQIIARQLFASLSSLHNYTYYLLYIGSGSPRGCVISKEHLYHFFGHCIIAPVGIVGVPHMSSFRVRLGSILLIKLCWREVSISCIACCVSGVIFLNEFNCKSPFNSSNTEKAESN